MKNQIFIRTLVVTAFLLASPIYFSSCQKTIETQTFNDAFDTSNLQKLNEVMQKSDNLVDLPDDFSSVTLTVPDALNMIQITDMISTIEKKINLSNSEIDLLLQNDVTTYSDVVDRIASSSIQLDELNITFTELNNSVLNKYSLIQKQTLDQYYTDDYYHSVLELQRYMKDFVIQPLQNLNSLIENTSVLKSGATDKAKLEKEKADKAKAALEALILKLKKEMEEAYEKKCKEEKEKKHKGSKGNNGNHYGNDK